MEKTFRYRIYPDKNQRKIMEQVFGSVRFVYNFFLAMRRNEYAIGYNTVSYKECSSQLTALKKEEGYTWLCNCDSTALQSALRNLDNAYRNFFSGNGKYPRFHSKHSHRDSYTTKNNMDSIRMGKNTIRLPKLGFVRTKVSRPVNGRILSATVNHVPSGRYYVSVLADCLETEHLSASDNACGIDMGVHDLLIFSDGTKISNPKYLEASLHRLRHQQRLLSRKTKGSRSWEKQRIRVARLQEHIACQRKDYLQKLSTQVVRKYGIIGVETLDIKSMLSDRSLPGSQRRTVHRSEAQTGMAMFLSMLSYKCSWYGRKLVTADRFFASSQTCSVCGKKNPAVKNLTVRSWICPSCGAHHDRDVNAAINLRQYALSH